jgi:hypothetical protein
VRRCAGGRAIGIPAEELQARRERLLDHLRGHGVTGFALFGARR